MTNVRDVISPTQFLYWQVIGYSIFAFAGLFIALAAVSAARDIAKMKPIARLSKAAPLAVRFIVLRAGQNTQVFSVGSETQKAVPHA